MVLTTGNHLMVAHHEGCQNLSPGLDDDLGVALRVGEIVEGGGDAVDADG
jgi:hypothetical protein